MRSVLLLAVTSATLLVPSVRAATPPSEIKVPEGFKVELLREAGQRDGSWISMGIDDAGRLYISPQGSIPETGFAKDSKWGGLVRATVGEKGVEKWERVPVPVGDAMGMLWAFDSLYVSGNGPEGRGIYRCKDTDGDSIPDSATMWKKVQGGAGEHGAHALVLGPDKKSIYIVHGNSTPLIEGIAPESPYRNWGEDDLLPKLKDPVATFFDKIKAPYGYVLRTDENGSKWELMAGGFRNPYDIDFNADGELFTYDSDMEWDRGLPWYRPSRVFHVVPGGEYGFREGSAKWPDWYPDALPPVVDIGLGCPTGVKFRKDIEGQVQWPFRYETAFFICDWTFGRVLAVQVKEKGASYTATNPLKSYLYPKDAEASGDVEVFLSGKGMPLTDIEFGKDGAMYLTVGGRGTQAGLYRVTWVGGDVWQGKNASQRKDIVEKWADAKMKGFINRIPQGYGPTSKTTSAGGQAWSWHLEKKWDNDPYSAFSFRLEMEKRMTPSSIEAMFNTANPEAYKRRSDDKSGWQRQIARMEKELQDSKTDEERAAIKSELAFAKSASAGSRRIQIPKDTDSANAKLAELKKLVAAETNEERKQKLTLELAAYEAGLKFATGDFTPDKSSPTSASANLEDPQKQIENLSLLLSLAKGSGASFQPEIFEALKLYPLASLSDAHRILKLRVIAISLARHGRPSEKWTKTGIEKLLASYPAVGTEALKLNRELSQTLVWLSNPELGDFAADAKADTVSAKDPSKPVPNPGANVHAGRKGADFQATLGTQIIEKTLALLDAAPTQEEQIYYALCLRWGHGWTPEQRLRYFRWFHQKASRYTGGNSFAKFVDKIRDDAASRVPESERAALTQWLRPMIASKPAAPPKPRDFVKAWTLPELETALDGLKARKADLKRGEALYAGAQCAQCHLYKDTGGNVGPDLTAVAQRFGRKDILEATIDPNKAVSDQYAMVTLTVTKAGGGGTEQVSGLVQEETSATITLLTDPVAGKTANYYTNVIKAREKANVSIMPPALLNTLSAEEVADLLAYMGAK